ncbi:MULTISPECIES: hypothetical protein [unclassified Staphylococcus]|nr:MULTISPECIES: hypothetical protein [unclassified Staphylococcus]UXR71070.1 hypothetical protein MUA88_07720 [Staphylococcus sp. IVB6240]UXR73364.1 hypothetical protein MUA48_08290 [Staphylococcus sp. IVB6238]UXR75660.1 hypothetical protein MUA74_08295 [Staphylococcus sp. IVB6233]
MEKVKAIARNVGVEVNPPELKGQCGIFIRNEKGEIEKWDAINEFKSFRILSQNFCHTYFNKQFYNNDNKLNTQTPYTSDYKDNYVNIEQYSGPRILLEAV